jgi:hypothetical protein
MNEFLRLTWFDSYQAIAEVVPRHIEGDASVVVRSLDSHPGGHLELDEKLMVVRSFDMNSRVIDAAVLDAIQARDLSVPQKRTIGLTRRQNEDLVERSCGGDCLISADCGSGCSCWHLGGDGHICK